jgi:hypothetical protein
MLRNGGSVPAEKLKPSLLGGINKRPAANTQTLDGFPIPVLAAKAGARRQRCIGGLALRAAWLLNRAACFDIAHPQRAKIVDDYAEAPNWVKSATSML